MVVHLKIGIDAQLSTHENGTWRASPLALLSQIHICDCSCEKKCYTWHVTLHFSALRRMVPFFHISEKGSMMTRFQ